MRKLLILSDGHVGSITGLWPFDFALPDGRLIGLNDGQKYLLKCWKELCGIVKEEKPQILIVNGDWIDGTQYRSLGAEAVTTLISAQKRASIELLSPVLEIVKEIYVIQGTDYHDQRSGEAAEDIAREIGARGPHRGAFSWEYLDLDVGGVLLNFSHGISVTTGLYRATALDRESLWSALAKDRLGSSADLIVRSHAHHYIHIESYNRHALITPCWQLPTRWMRRHSLFRFLPDIGAVFITVNPSAKKKGLDPISIRKVLFPLPPITPVKLGG